MCNLSQGIEENVYLNVAKKMIERGDSINDIVELTELAVDVIEKLKIDVPRVAT